MTWFNSPSVKKIAVAFLMLISAPAVAAPPPPPGQALPLRPMFAPGMAPQQGFVPQPNSDGIYSHQVYSAVSSDLVTWRQDGVLLFDHASVPEAVIDANGVISLYFMDASERPDKMSVAVSADGGRTWDKKTVVIANRQTQGQAVDPNVIVLPDGTFRMFYLGTFGPPNPNQTQESRICSATSKDGVNFTEEPGVRFSKSGMITDPDVVKTVDGWRMFVSNGMTNLSTTSQDGQTFVESGAPAATDGAVSKTVATKSGWRMFRCSRGGIVSQATTDFVSWTQEGVRLAAVSGQMFCDPSVITLPDGTYKMFYKTMPLRGGF